MTATTPAPVDRAARRQLVLLGLVALVLAGAVVGGWFDRNLLLPDPATWEEGRLISSAYDPPTEKVELFLNQGDGQLFATHAQDPFLQHPERFWGGPSEQAYRLQRPLYGWLGWAASGGNPGAAGWAIVVLTVVSVPLLVVAAGFAATRFGAAPAWGLLVLVAPGVLADLLRGGPEVFGTALLAAALAAWFGPRRRVWLAVALFAAAGLARETLLVVPVALLVAEALPERRRDAWPLLASLGPYALWLLVLRVHVGALPEGSVSGRLSPVPFGGLARAVGGWRRDEVLAAGVLLLLAVAGLVLGRDRRLRVIVAANVALAAVLGEPVWLRYLDFGRVLLPLALVSVLSIASAHPAHERVEDDVVEPALAPA